LTALLRGLLDLVIPRHCARCGDGLADPWAPLCEACDARLPWLDESGCARCQQQPALGPRPLCGSCAATPSSLDACIAAAEYAGDTQDWIRRFKYPGGGLAGLDPRPGAVLRSLARHAAERLPAPDLVVPIPLHRRRLIGRGFNPAGLLAREVARTVGASCAPTGLRRTRDTPSQTGFGRHARQRNVAGAFEARRSFPARVWIVDDVVTTGSTLEAAAVAARAAGARHVAAVCAARTPSPDRLR
jgi:ComF family protein